MFSKPPAHILLTLVLVASFAVKMSFLLQTPHFAGNDSGYYVWHVNDILAGRPYLSEPPLVFYVSAFFALLLGGNAMLGVKITLALFSTLIAVPFYLLVRDATKNPYLGAAAAFLGAFAASNWWVSVGHIKNIGGLFFGLFVVYYFIKTLKDPRLPNLALLGVSLLLMAGSHFSTSAYVVAALFPAAIAILARSVIKQDRPAIRAVLVFLAAVTVVAIMVLLIDPGILGEGSIGTIGLYGAQPQQPGHGEELVNLSILWRYLPLCPFALLGLAVLWRDDRNALLVFLFWLIASLFLTQPLFMQRSWLLRFEMMSFLPVVLLASVGLAYFKDRRIAVLLLLALSAYFLFDFLMTNERGIPMPVSTGEFLGFSSLHSRFPDEPVVTGNLGLRYWLLAMGCDVYESAPSTGTATRFLFIQETGPPQGAQPGASAPGPWPSQPATGQSQYSSGQSAPDSGLPAGASEVERIGKYAVFLAPAK